MRRKSALNKTKCLEKLFVTSRKNHSMPSTRAHGGGYPQYSLELIIEAVVQAHELVYARQLLLLLFFAGKGEGSAASVVVHAGEHGKTKESSMPEAVVHVCFGTAAMA